MKKSRDGKIKFYEGKHIYKLGKVELTSGTTFLGPYFQPFDAKAIAKKLASFWANKQKKHGVRWFLKDWKESAEHGTRVHYLMEQYLLEQDNKPNELHNVDELTTQCRDLTKFEQGMEWLDRYMKSVKDLEPVYHPEDIVYNKELLIAGQIDVLVERLDIQTGEIVCDLIDWKTNKKISPKNYEGLACYEPLQDFESSTLLKYQLQLSLYAYLLELQGKKIGRLILAHISETNVNEIEMEYRPDLVKRLVEYRSK
jgi:hypothetical protein